MPGSVIDYLAQEKCMRGLDVGRPLACHSAHVLAAQAEGGAEGTEGPELC